MSYGSIGVSEVGRQPYWGGKGSVKSVEVGGGGLAENLRKAF